MFNNMSSDLAIYKIVYINVLTKNSVARRCRNQHVPPIMTIVIIIKLKQIIMDLANIIDKKYT